jgi:hypothetical protein
MWSVCGSASWAACSCSAQHPSQVGGMHPQWTLIDCGMHPRWTSVYHFFIIQATCIWLLLIRHSMKTLLYSSFLDDLVDYGLYRNRGPTSIGSDGLFVEPSLNALIRVMVNLMCKAEYMWNVAKYFLLSNTMVVTESGSVVLSIQLKKIL